jgi:hypothetical protein
MCIRFAKQNNLAMELNEITYDIRGAGFEANKILGHGFLEKVHEAQLLNYLKATGIKINLLVNMKYPKAEIKRMVFDLPEGRDN